VLAVAEMLGTTGKDLLLALIISYELQCRFVDSVPFNDNGWDQPVPGVMACALACGRLLELSRAAMHEALALAIIPNLCTYQARAGELSMWKGCAAGNAARNGIFAAQLAQHGLTGPDEAIEGRWGLQHALGRFAWAPFGGRGGPFRLTQTHLKYFPAVVHSQSPITAAIELHAQVKPEDIKAVVVDTYWVAKRYTDRASPLWHPGTRETADHSLPYIIAAALIDGTISAASFSDERLRDRRIADLLEKMSLREKPEYTRAHPSSWPCRIEITTHAGERKAASVEYFKGHAKNPMSDAEVETKFRDLTAPFMKPARVDAILAKLWMLEQLADIGEVIELLAVDPVR